MAVPLSRLPRYLVLEPVSTVRLEVTLRRPSCEIDVELENPKPGRSFLLVLGPVGGPVLQRMRLTGRARIVFEPHGDRSHVLMLANPQKEPLVLRLKGRTLRRPVEERVQDGKAPPVRRRHAGRAGRASGTRAAVSRLGA